MPQKLPRRRLLAGAATLAIASAPAMASFKPHPMTLLSASIELAGDWGHMIPDAAHHVVDRMRHACLDNVRLISDRQPTRIRVDEHTSGPPAIWLHYDDTPIAWIIVDITERDWSRLAYQFGHELGHVTANSWQPNAKPAPPCQWLEEALVEAFSLRGLARLAQSWRENPPFANDNAFGDAIAKYQDDIIRNYAKLAGDQGSIRNPATWFATNREKIESEAGLGPYAQAASLTMLAEYHATPTCLEALGALNRWPARSAIPLEDYLHHWQASCTDLGASPHLPTRLQELLGLA